MTHRTILAFCPDHYRPDYEYLFVAVAAEFVPAARMWTRVGNTASQFPPEGAVFVPRAMLPEPFRPGDTAAWVLQDQPDYQQQGLSTRYRAIRTYQGPPEIVAVPKASEDIAGARRALLEEGLDGVFGPEGREVLLEFTDGWVAGPVTLEEKPATPRRYRATAQALARPLPAWKARAALQPLRLEWEGRAHFFSGTEVLPPPQEYLDFSSLEEALRSTHFSGGLRSVAGTHPIEVESLAAFLEQVRSALPGHQFQVRRRRLEQLLEQAQKVSVERTAWEEHLTSHPVFQRALHQAIERMRDELTGEARRRILAEEVEHREHIRQLEQEESAHRRALDQLRGVAQQAAAALEVIQEPNAGLGTRNSEPLHLGGSSAELRAELANPFQAVDHLGSNLERLGLRPASARLLARTAFAAASLGQMLFVRGSLALPVAETVARSLAGERTTRLTLTADRTALVDPLESDPESSGTALILDGINRVNVGTCGADLLRLLRDRALGLAGWPPTPILLATLVAGADVRAADAALLAHGPVFDVDALSWNDAGAAVGAVAAECHTSAWDVPGGSGDAAIVMEVVEDIIPLPDRLWQRNVHAAARRLTALTLSGQPPEPMAALLFGWVLPWLAASGGLRADRIRERFPDAVTDEHVSRLLRSYASANPSKD